MTRYVRCFFRQWAQSELLRNQQLLHVPLHTLSNRDWVVTSLQSTYDPSVRVRIGDLQD